MNCWNCPYRFTDKCRIEFLNGIPVCTAYLKNNNCIAPNNTLGKQSNSSANTPENCMNLFKEASE